LKDDSLNFSFKKNCGGIKKIINLKFVRSVIKKKSIAWSTIRIEKKKGGIVSTKKSGCQGKLVPGNFFFGII
jgi:hypothetical protein